MTLCHILPERRGWVNMIMPCFSTIFNLKSWNILEKIRTALKKNKHHTISHRLNNPLNHQRSTGKECWGNTTVHWFLQGIQFHTQKKDATNPTSRWSFQRNCYHHNKALQKHKINGSFTWWKQWLLWHSCWSLTRRYHICLYSA